jgi:pantetheine-phosphate adenylyltransferase
MLRKIVYSGTFDPITFGHMDLVDRALYLFDEVVIGVSTGTGKTPLFSADERANLAQELFKDEKRVKIKLFSGLLVDFVDSVGAKAVLRGLRAVSDFEYEFQMAAINRKLNDQVETIFLAPSEQYTCLSSTMIREVAKIDPNRIPDMVHPKVVKALIDKLSL